GGARRGHLPRARLLARHGQRLPLPEQPRLPALVPECGRGRHGVDHRPRARRRSRPRRASGEPAGHRADEERERRLRGGGLRRARATQRGGAVHRPGRLERVIGGGAGCRPGAAATDGDDHPRALGRSLKPAYHRVTFLWAGSRETPAKFPKSSAARRVQSAIDGRSPATKGPLPIRSSSTFRLLARRARALSAASGDCFTRPAKKGLVFWKIVPTLARTPISAIRSSSRTRARSSDEAPIIDGFGWSSSRYSMMARDSVRWLPSSSSRTGSPPSGFFVRNSGVRFFPDMM